MTFQPGNRANPSGRPKGVAGASAELSRRIAYATDDGAALHEALIEIVFGRCPTHGAIARCSCPSDKRTGKVGGDGASPRENKLRHEALFYLIERWAGKPSQQIDVDVTVTPVVSLLDEITPEQRLQLDGVLEIDDDAAIAAVAEALTLQ